MLFKRSRPGLPASSLYYLEQKNDEKVQKYFKIVCDRTCFLLVCCCEQDEEYYNKMETWGCHLNYGASKKQLSHSFGYCFKEPSVYCRNHAVAMNGCKQYKNMGLYCCLMQDIKKAVGEYLLPSWINKEHFLYITSIENRPSRMFLFFAMDITIGEITSPEEMSAFLAIVISYLPFIHIFPSLRAHFTQIY